MYSIVPFGLIICSNIVLIHSLISDRETTIKRSKSDKAKRRTVSISVLCLSICFILFTSPQAIMVGYFLNDNLIQYTVYTVILSLSYHSFTFVVLKLSNNQFSKVVKSTFRCTSQGNVDFKLKNLTNATITCNNTDK